MHDDTAKEWRGEERRRNPRLRMLIDALDSRTMDLFTRFVELSSQVDELRQEVARLRDQLDRRPVGSRS